MHKEGDEPCAECAQVGTVLAIIDQVLDYFKDPRKAREWMVMPNPAFGGFTAMDLIRRGRATVVLKIIEELRSGL